MNKYTTFVYADERGDKLVETKEFDSRKNAVAYADTMLDTYERVEVIENEEEKIY